MVVGREEAPHPPCLVSLFIHQLVILHGHCFIILELRSSPHITIITTVPYQDPQLTRLLLPRASCAAGGHHHHHHHQHHHHHHHHPQLTMLLPQDWPCRWWSAASATKRSCFSALALPFSHSHHHCCQVSKPLKTSLNISEPRFSLPLHVCPLTSPLPQSLGPRRAFPFAHVTAVASY